MLIKQNKCSNNALGGGQHGARCLLQNSAALQVQVCAISHMTWLCCNLAECLRGTSVRSVRSRAELQRSAAASEQG